jgi:predicted phosphoribosyltransferase
MFRDRVDAGRQLAEVVDSHDIEADIVLAVPRGGLPVGRVVADRLGIPLDIVVARKIGAPWNSELAIGAVASDGTVWLNERLIDEFGVTEAYLDEQTERERRAAIEKRDRYRAGRDPPALDGKTVLVVDDGVATGATTTACLKQVANAGAERVVLAVPVGPPTTAERLQRDADDVVFVETPPHFGAVGQFYDSFPQVSDEEAMALLSE